jgi:hypothetical protein
MFTKCHCELWVHFLGPSWSKFSYFNWHGLNLP